MDAYTWLVKILQKVFLIDKELVPYEVFLSRVARCARIQISAERGLRVVLPKNFPLSDVEKMLSERRMWITDKVRSIAKIPRLADGLVVRILEREIILVMHESACTELREHFLHLPARRAKEAFREWLREEARKYFSVRLPELSRELDISFRRFSVRAQKTRWGSASRRRTISLNYKLLLMPLWVSDYVMIHELCHLVHMNHSLRFWKLVESFCPRFREARKWLRKEGRYLPV